jgi:hypothetical protein
VTRWPNFTGGGNFRSATQSQIVDLETGTRFTNSRNRMKPGACVEGDCMSVSPKPGLPSPQPWRRRRVQLQRTPGHLWIATVFIGLPWALSLWIT